MDSLKWYKTKQCTEAKMINYPVSRIHCLAASIEEPFHNCRFVSYLCSLMRLASLTTSCCLVAICQGFSNTAPMLVEFSNPTPKFFLPDVSYLTKYESVRLVVDSLTERWCNVDSEEKIVIVQAPGFSKRLLSEEVSSNQEKSVLNRMYRSSKSFVSPHVYYDSDGPNQLYSSNCLQGSHLVEIKISEWEDAPLSYESFFQDLSSSVFSVQLPPQGTLNDEDYLKSLREALSNLKVSISRMPGISVNFIVQGLPLKFQNSFIKREHISSNSTIGSGSAMDKYTFFTPGIWMTTIVSLFLVWIFSIALNWVSSLQISYKAFEKQVNPQKKTQ